jgi:AcrR family transcriptional regulator
MAQFTARKSDTRENSPIPETARERLLKAATALFFRYGINATGVDAIVEAANTAKATLYKSFGSKEGLVEAVLRAEGEAWRLWFSNALDCHPGSPREKLAGVFDVLEEWFASGHFYGCPFTNAVGEFDKNDQRYKTLALAQKRVVIDHIAQLAEKAGIKDAPALANQLGLLVDGAIATALITGNPNAAQIARAAAAKIVAAS